MQITQLDAQTYVGPQISIANLNDLKRLNVKTVVVARPEGETADQTCYIRSARRRGCFGHHCSPDPVVPGNIADADVRAFRAIASEADHPVFAYCRSGMRATSLWALSAAEQGQSPDEILRMAKAAGFDLAPLLARLSVNAA